MTETISKKEIQDAKDAFFEYFGIEEDVSIYDCGDLNTLKEDIGIDYRDHPEIFEEIANKFKLYNNYNDVIECMFRRNIK